MTLRPPSSRAERRAQIKLWEANGEADVRCWLTAIDTAKALGVRP